MDVPALSSIFTTVADWAETPAGKVALPFIGAALGYGASEFKNWNNKRKAKNEILKNSASHVALNISRTFITASGDFCDVHLENHFGHIVGESGKMTLGDILGGGSEGFVLAEYAWSAVSKHCTEENPLVLLHLDKVITDSVKLEPVLSRIDTAGRNILSGLLNIDNVDSLFGDERLNCSTGEILPVLVYEPWTNTDKNNDPKQDADHHCEQMRVFLVPKWQLNLDNIKKLKDSLRFRTEDGTFKEVDGHHRHKQRIKSLLAIAEAWQDPEKQKILGRWLISRTSVTPQNKPQLAGGILTTPENT